MHKIFKNCEWQHGRYKRAIPDKRTVTPYSGELNLSYDHISGIHYEELYNIRLTWEVRQYFSLANSSSKMDEIKEIALNHLHKHFYGEIENLLDHLKCAIYYEDLESSKEIIKLMQNILQGNN